MILHEVTGSLVDPESSYEIAGAILHILENPEEAASLGENGRRRGSERIQLEDTRN